MKTVKKSSLDLEPLPQSRVVSVLAEQDPRASALFLGAGASKSAGVLLGWEMIKEWRAMAHEDSGSKVKLEEWCLGQSWFEQENEYSRLFELVFPDSAARQTYIEKKMKHAFPSWGYLYLANIVQHGRFNIIFTTNFDDLVNEALTIFLGYNPVVCAADSEVGMINVNSKRAKIIKLHGDYLFKSIKNTEEELRQLSANMRHKFQQFGDLCGFVVIGYAGRDESIMSVFEEAMRDPAAFPYGIYWGIREGSEIAPRVAELARAHPRRFHLFRCDDFDAFMAAMHEVSGEDANEEPCALELPTAIVNPYQAMEQRYQRLVEFAEENMPTDPLVVEDVQRLQAELRRKRPWADATGDEFDLLQAQMALARRDYQSALQAITPFLEKHPKHAEGLAALGNALMIKGEEEGSPAAELEAVAKWKEAIAQNSRALLPRYGLMRYYGLHHLMAEGIEVGEQLIKLVPNDVSLRRNLVQFYGQAGRYDEAERELQWLLQRDPQNADIHGNRAALLEQRGLIREAIEELRQAVSLAPQNPWTRFAFGGALAKTNRLAEAATEFEEAIRLDPRNISFRTQTAQFYLMQNQAQRALPHLQTAVSIAPLSAEAHGWLCQAWLFLQNFPAAQSEGEEAVRLSPNDTRLRLTVGMAHEQMNRPQEAEAHYVAATQANPNGAEGYVSLALLYFRQNRGAEFNGVFQRISQINPQAAHGLQMQLQQIQQTQATGARPDWLGALRHAASLFQETPPGVAAQSGWPQPPPGGNPSYRPR